MGDVAKGNNYGEGIPVILRGGRVVFAHALSFATMKRTRDARKFIQEHQDAAGTEEWHEASLTVIHAAITEGGDDISREELERLLTPRTSAECFKAMVAAARGLTEIPKEEVAEQSTSRPSKSQNGTNSMPMSSPTQDGIGSVVTS